MKMHPSNHHAHGVDKGVAHDFAINSTGTAISFQFPPHAQISLSGEKAKAFRAVLNALPEGKAAPKIFDMQLTEIQTAELREFLNRCELRTDAEAAALGPAPPESDSGKGTRVDLLDGTHAYGKTPEEVASHQGTATANHKRIHAGWYAAQKPS
jgi:hypothetical protein